MSNSEIVVVVLQIPFMPMSPDASAAGSTSQAVSARGTAVEPLPAHCIRRSGCATAAQPGRPGLGWPPRPEQCHNWRFGGSLETLHMPAAAPSARALEQHNQEVHLGGENSEPRGEAKAVWDDGRADADVREIETPPGGSVSADVSIYYTPAAELQGRCLALTPALASPRPRLLPFGDILAASFASLAASTGPVIGLAAQEAGPVSSSSKMDVAGEHNRRAQACQDQVMPASKQLTAHDVPGPVMSAQRNISCSPANAQEVCQEGDEAEPDLGEAETLEHQVECHSAQVSPRCGFDEASSAGMVSLVDAESVASCAAASPWLTPSLHAPSGWLAVADSALRQHKHTPDHDPHNRHGPAESALSQLQQTLEIHPDGQHAAAVQMPRLPQSTPEHNRLCTSEQARLAAFFPSPAATSTPTASLSFAGWAAVHGTVEAVLPLQAMPNEAMGARVAVRKTVVAARLLAAAADQCTAFVAMQPTAPKLFVDLESGSPQSATQPIGELQIPAGEFAGLALQQHRAATHQAPDVGPIHSAASKLPIHLDSERRQPTPEAKAAQQVSAGQLSNLALHQQTAATPRSPAVVSMPSAAPELRADLESVRQQPAPKPEALQQALAQSITPPAVLQQGATAARRLHPGAESATCMTGRGQDGQCASSGQTCEADSSAWQECFSQEDIRWAHSPPACISSRDLRADPTQRMHFVRPTGTNERGPCLQQEMHEQPPSTECNPAQSLPADGLAARLLCEAALAAWQDYMEVRRHKW
jgi:hypothetical protein